MQYNREYNPAGITLPVAQLVDSIAAQNEVMGSAVGFAGIRPRQYDHFMRLKEKASEQELLDLTGHPNPAVRSYAFWALAGKTPDSLFPVIADHLNDTARVETMFGCFTEQIMVGDFFIAVATGNIEESLHKLSKKEQLMLDSLLLHTKNSLSTRAINSAKN